MKKFFYVITLAILTSMSIAGCTEEAVNPSTTENGGSAGSGDPLPR